MVSWLARLKRFPVCFALSTLHPFLLARANVPPLGSGLKQSGLLLGRAPYLGDGWREKVAEDPVGGDPHLALRAVEPHEVGHAPEDGGDHPGKLDAHHLVDGEVAPELYELSEGFVLELFEVVLAVYGPDDVLGRHVAFLYGSLGGRRDDPAIFQAHVLDGGAVPYGPDVALAVNPQRKVYLYSGPLVERQPELLYRLVRAVAGGPDHVLRGDLPAPLELDAAVGYFLRHRAGEDLDALVGQPRAGGTPERRVEFRQDV